MCRCVADVCIQPPALFLLLKKTLHLFFFDTPLSLFFLNTPFPPLNFNFFLHLESNLFLFPPFLRSTPPSHAQAREYLQHRLTVLPWVEYYTDQLRDQEGSPARAAPPLSAMVRGGEAEPYRSCIAVAMPDTNPLEVSSVCVPVGFCLKVTAGGNPGGDSKVRATGQKGSQFHLMGTIKHGWRTCS